MLPSRVLGAAVTAALTAVPAIVLAACGGSDDPPAGPKKIAIELTDAGCEPATLALDAGPTSFEVTNAGTGRVTDFEVLDGSKILGRSARRPNGRRRRRRPS